MIFAWSTLDEIYREESYFFQDCEVSNDPASDTPCASQSSELGQIITVAGAVAGVILMLSGLLRDHLGFGPGLLIMKSLVTIGYILLANAEPLSSDNLLYGWALQYGSAVSQLFFYIQLARLFDLTSFLISCMMLTMALSSFIPELWKALLIKHNFRFRRRRISSLNFSVRKICRRFSLE